MRRVRQVSTEPGHDRVSQEPAAGDPSSDGLFSLLTLERTSMGWLLITCTLAVCVSCAAGAIAPTAAQIFWPDTWQLFGTALGELPIQDIGNLTATAILGWYAWHTASRTIPQLVMDFRQEMAAQRELYREETNEVRSEMAIERERRHKDQMCIVGALQELGYRFSAEAHSAGHRPPKGPSV